MPEAPTYISGFEKIVDLFGYWPRFHDSPVLLYTSSVDSVKLEFGVWEMTPELDAGGYFILTKQHRVGLRFSGISAAGLEDFTDDNILLGLLFSPPTTFQATARFHVELDSAIGGESDGCLEAAHGEITLIRPL